MARFNNISELKTAANITYKKLVALIDTLSLKKQEEQFTFDISGETAVHWSRDQNIKDVLIHIYEWQILIISWVNSNEHGITKSFLPEKYNWKTYGDMNIEFWKKHQLTTLLEARRQLDISHDETIKLMESIDSDKVFSKGTYAGGSTIGQYFISATVGHYDWALKKIKKHIK